MTTVYYRNRQGQLHHGAVLAHQNGWYLVRHHPSRRVVQVHGERVRLLRRERERA